MIDNSPKLNAAYLNALYYNTKDDSRTRYIYRQMEDDANCNKEIFGLELQLLRFDVFFLTRIYRPIVTRKTDIFFCLDCHSFVISRRKIKSSLIWAPKHGNTISMKAFLKHDASKIKLLSEMSILLAHFKDIYLRSKKSSGFYHPGISNKVCRLPQKHDIELHEITKRQSPKKNGKPNNVYSHLNRTQMRYQRQTHMNQLV